MARNRNDQTTDHGGMLKITKQNILEVHRAAENVSAVSARSDGVDQ